MRDFQFVPHAIEHAQPQIVHSFTPLLVTFTIIIQTPFLLFYLVLLNLEKEAFISYRNFLFYI
jgi:hypothetical protein